MERHRLGRRARRAGLRGRHGGAYQCWLCHRDAEYDISRQAVPGGAGFNLALGTGVDVLLGGTTLVLVTHDPALAAHAGRIITLRDGLVVSDKVQAGASPVSA